MWNPRAICHGFQSHTLQLQLEYTTHLALCIKFPNDVQPGAQVYDEEGK
jgi:hypothetical protein